MTIGLLIIYGLLALLVIVSALGMLRASNAVHAALFLVVNFATVAVLYLTLGAPFIALAQISVYAGAIMVLFLFVIMLLGAEALQMGQPRRYHLALAVLLGLIFVAEAALFLLFRSGLGMEPLPALSPEFASPAALGQLLFSQYTLPFEITSLLLLAAVVGAIFLTRPERVEVRRQVRRVEQQVKGNPVHTAINQPVEPETTEPRS